MEYKDTLNLPKTTLEMRANATKKEPETQKFWEGINVYEKNLAQMQKEQTVYTTQCINLYQEPDGDGRQVGTVSEQILPGEKRRA